uniref:Uncharacterized protein n=1 Tax=Rhipicephalus zambeziensis TaxID=60191 RepID=A0A224YKP7_9ACAR
MRSKSCCANHAHGPIVSPQSKSIMTVCCSRVFVAEREKNCGIFQRVRNTYTCLIFYSIIFLSFTFKVSVTVGCEGKWGACSFPSTRDCSS